MCKAHGATCLSNLNHWTRLNHTRSLGSTCALCSEVKGCTNKTQHAAWAKKLCQPRKSQPRGQHHTFRNNNARTYNAARCLLAWPFNFLKSVRKSVADLWPYQGTRKVLEMDCKCFWTKCEGLGLLGTGKCMFSAY